MDKVQEFYMQHGVMTKIGYMEDMVKDLPKAIEGIVSIVQNIFLHQHWAQRYGVELEPERRQEPWIRAVEEKLVFLNKQGYQHVSDKRSVEDKMVAVCRDYSVMAAALCIEAGIPARARSGFATYFEKGKYMDHWVLEYWNEDEKRWILVDAQLDELQRQALQITFDPLDVSEDDFITGARAWSMCRGGEANPELFGIAEWWGYDYVKSNLILDANSLLKVPMHSWDGWKGYKNIQMSEWSEQDYLLMDQLSKQVMDVDNNLEGLQLFIQENDGIIVPEDLSEVMNFLLLVG